MLLVGTAQANITPDQPMRVAGMLNPPLVERAAWPLYTRAFVFSSGSRTLAFIVLDNLLLAPALVAGFRARVVDGTSIAPEDVMVTCTHTHRAPFAAALMDEEIAFDYVDWMANQSAAALRAALADLQPASLRFGCLPVPGWTFNRRQVYRSERYGEQVGTQGPQQAPGFLRNEGPEDDSLSVLHMATADGRSLGTLVNFACHTTVMGGEHAFSADYAGALTEQLAKALGGVAGFLQGAAGNLWAIDTRRITSMLEADYLGPAHAETMGAALADAAQQALAQGSSQSGLPLQMARRVLNIPQRRFTREQVALAKQYLEHQPENLDQAEFTRLIYGHDYTFYNNDATVQEWFARETIGMWEWQRRAGTRELVEAVEVQVFRIGEIAIVGLPGEIFTEFGLEIKARSPFPQTIVVELANGWHGYIPTREAFQHGGYEPRPGYTSRLVPEAGEQMVAAALDLLAQCRGE